MREIRFRIWDEDEKRFLKPIECSQLVIRPLSGRVTDGATVPNVTLMQYTGLKDKNGVEIYEGDILKFIEVNNERLLDYLTDVRWEDCSFVVKSGGKDYDTWLGAWSGDPNNCYPLFEIEVIGNTYENPELLLEVVK